VFNAYVSHRTIWALVSLVPFAAPSYGSDALDSSEGEASKLEQVVVTATKRTEDIQDVPASIQAISADTLTDAHVDSLIELSRLVPGFSIPAADSPFNSIQLRGIGTISNGYNVEPSVATVVDGVAMARSGSTTFIDYNDVSRIEVLRGPQGTLFGKNASVGVLNIVTKDPTNTFEGELGASDGTYNDIKVNGILSGPLLDDELMGRISLYSNSRNGYIYDIADGRNLNDDHQQGGRVKLLFTPMDGTRLLASADYEHQAASGLDASPVRALTPSTLPIVLGADPASFPGYPPGFVSTTNTRVDAGAPSLTRTISKGISLQWDQELGMYTLTSITAYRSWSAPGNGALAENSIPVLFVVDNPYTVDQNQISEELRIASPRNQLVEYVGGLFFFKDDISNHEYFLLDFAGLGLAPATSDIDYSSRELSKNYAVFGESTTHLTRDLSLIAGARVTRQTADFHLVGHYLFDAPLGADSSDQVNNVSWRAGARWTIAPDNMVYLTASRGFKGPGFNGNSSILGQAELVKPEVSTNYEIGWKAQFLDQRVRADFAVFRQTLDNFQVQGYVQAPPQAGQPATYVQYLTNAPQLRSQGVEIEIKATPMRNLLVGFDGAYNDAKYTDFPNSPCYTGQTALQGCMTVGGAQIQNLSGKPTPKNPTRSFDVNGNYIIGLPSFPFDAFVRSDFSWRSKVIWDATENPLLNEGAYGLLGASIGIEGRNGRYSVTAYGKNLTDRFHTANISLTPQNTIVQYVPPDYQRIWGVSFIYRF
jgi:iron complex outermembrane recepter protein